MMCGTGHINKYFVRNRTHKLRTLSLCSVCAVDLNFKNSTTIGINKSKIILIAIFDTSRSAEGKHEHERPLARVRVFSRSTTYECRKCVFGTSAPNGILGAAAPKLKKK